VYTFQFNIRSKQEQHISRKLDWNGTYLMQQFIPYMYVYNFLKT
jgi:hypothetical protein